MGYAFISYSSVNRASADALNDLLKRNGIKSWMAPGDIPPGKAYADSITDALKQCACFVLLLTEHSQSSEWVSKELERAVSYKKPIIPVMLEDFELDGKFELYIGEYQIVSVKRIDENTAEMKRILAGIRAHTDDGSAHGRSAAQTPAASEIDELSVRVGDIVEFGRYYIDDEDELTPIHWRILRIKNGKALLVSCMALNGMPFNTDTSTALWRDCSLRKWLNGEFCETAFSEREREMLLPTSVFTEGSGKTTDSVYLLTREDSLELFHGNQDRVCIPTAYAKVCGAYPSSNPNVLEHCWWWLRTRSRNPKHGCVIGYDGSARTYAYIADDCVGVRPAITVSTELFK